MSDNSFNEFDVIHRIVKDATGFELTKTHPFGPSRTIIQLANPGRTKYWTHYLYGDPEPTKPAPPVKVTDAMVTAAVKDFRRSSPCCLFTRDSLRYALIAAMKAATEDTHD